MSGNNILADTNAIIAVMSRLPAVRDLLDRDWYFSFITRIELLSKPDIDAYEEGEVLKTLEEAELAPYNAAIETATINLRRKHRCKLPDAIIAATSMHYGLTLLTFDRGFARFDGLDVIVLEYV